MSASQYVSVVARKHQLPEQLVAAIVQVESGGDRCATRVEPAYPYLWDVKARAPFAASAAIASRRLPPDYFPAPPGVSRLTEWIGQQTSWGYMQVMGAVAREYGFVGPFFTALCDPMEGLNYGCLHLAWLRGRFHLKHGWRGVVAAYNAGTPREISPGVYSNQAYVDKVGAAGGFDGL